MADDGGNTRVDREEAKPPRKRRKPATRLGKFEFHAKLDNVLGKVLDGKELPREPPGPKLPTRFVLINELGKGAQSSVYAVFDRELNCKAALKFFKGGGEGRGAREARVLSGVEHPNVVRVQDVQITAEKRLYMRMDFIDGPTLRKWVEGRRWREVLGAYVQAGRGLAAAHKAGIIHRDFKPENALVRESDNRVVVVDFGLARGRDDSPEVAVPHDPATSTASQSFPLLDTRSGLMGTIAYMAPEQLTGKQDAVDERSDQFSFCVALYEALDGERPFPSTSYAELVDAVTAGRFKGPPRNTPPWVWRVIRRGLSVDPAQRYPSMNALLHALGNDPRKWFVRSGLFAAGLALAGWGWQAFDDRDERQQRMIAWHKAAEKEAVARKEAAEQMVRDRGDAVTLREAKTVMADDPTRAMALLASLSADSSKWSDTRVRMLVADADYRGVARHVMVLGSAEEPYGLSPDGTMAVTRHHTTGEVSLHLLDEQSRRSLGMAHTGLPVVAFSPDGRFIATQRVPKGVHRWEARSDRPPISVGETSDDHHRILFVGGEAGIVTFGRNPDVVRWHAGGRQVLGGHIEPVDAVAIDTKGRFAATFDGSRKLRLWDLAQGTARSLAGVTAPIAFSPEGTLAVTASAACSELVEGPVTEVRIVDPLSGAHESLCTDSAAPLSSIVFSPDGQRVAAALPGHVKVWELDTGERVDLDRPDEETSELLFATSDVLGSQSHDTTLVIWVLPSERPYVLQGHAGVAHWGRRTDGTIVTYGNEGQIRLWTLPKRSDRPLPGHDDAVLHVAYAGAELLTAGRDGSVRAWPLDGGPDRTLLEGRREVAAMAVDSDGRRVALVRGRGQVVLLDVDGGGEETTLAEREQVFALAWDRGGEAIVIADKSGGVDVLDPTGSVRVTLRGADGYRVRGAQFHADGKRIVTAGWTDDTAISIRVFDVASGEAVLQQELDASVGKDEVDVSGVVAVAFSGDDRSVAITTFQRSVLVWDEEAGPRVVGKHEAQVPGAAFSPDGTLLVTVDEIGVAKLWDVATGFHRTIRFRGPLRAVAFGPTGRFAAVGDARVAFFGRDDLPAEAAALREWVVGATDLEVQRSELDWAAQ
jgi:WD40 repeat protein/predicted Ser/Thr protein kinase